MEEGKKRKKKLECFQCGGHTIYTSKWKTGVPVISCFTCGETEDSRKGIGVTISGKQHRIRCY